MRSQFLVIAVVLAGLLATWSAAAPATAPGVQATTAPVAVSAPAGAGVGSQATTAPAAAVAPAKPESGQTASAPTPTTDPLFAFYAANLRASLFAGFLTLGSFLVAVNTFIIVNLKKEVYDHAEYRKQVLTQRDQQRAANKGANKPTDDGLGSFYGPLRRLSRLIFWTIMLALSTSVSQLTLGVLWWHRAAAIICLALAALTMLFLFFTLYQIGCNLKDWFDFWEDDAARLEQKAKDEAAAAAGGAAA